MDEGGISIDIDRTAIREGISYWTHAHMRRLKEEL
jgi:hypothetical protein